MRRQGRIKEILMTIEQQWNKYPDQRLGQLLQNYFGYPRGDIFFIEDTVFDVEVFDNRTGFMTKKQNKEIKKHMKKMLKEAKNGKHN